MRKYGIPAFVLDTGLSTLCLLLSITTYAAHSVLLNILLLTPAFMLYFQPVLAPSRREKFVEKRQNAPGRESSTRAVGSHKPFVTAYRGGMMVITCLAILAVDFKVFPRRFAKAEMWGTSLVCLAFGG